MRWTENDRTKLKVLFGTVKRKELHRFFPNRTQGAIDSEAKRLGLATWKKYPELWTLRELSDHYGVPYRVLRRRLEKGVLVRDRVGADGAALFSTENFERFLESQKNSAPDGWLEISQAASILGIDVRAVRRVVRLGLLPARNFSGFKAKLVCEKTVRKAEKYMERTGNLIIRWSEI